MKSNSKAHLNNGRNSSSSAVSASNVSLKSDAAAMGMKEASKIANFSKSDEACNKAKLSNGIDFNGIKQPQPQQQQQQQVLNGANLPFQFINNAHLTQVSYIANLLALQNLLINEQTLVDAIVKIQLLANQHQQQQQQQQQQQIHNASVSLQANDLTALRNKLTQYMRQQNTSHAYLNYLASLLSTFTSPAALSTFISSLPSSLQQLCTQMQQTTQNPNQNGNLANSKSQTLVSEKIKNLNLNAAGGDAPVQNNADGQQAQSSSNSSNQKSIPTQQDGDCTTAKASNTSILENPQSKYPLECSWSFWFFKNSRDTDWKENLTLLTTVDNVEDFWAVYNHLRPVSHLHEGCDYMLFKKDIKPMWEDEENRHGGRWLASFEKEQRSQSLDTYWLHTLLSLIGSQYDDESGIVNGAVVNIRYKTDKLSLWTKNYDNDDAQNRIVARFKKVLGIKEGPLIYEIHEKHY